MSQKGLSVSAREIRSDHPLSSCFNDFQYVMIVIFCIYYKNKVIMFSSKVFVCKSSLAGRISCLAILSLLRGIFINSSLCYPTDRSNETK